MNIILFNGPPGCGKDTAAFSIFERRYDFLGTIKFDRMSMPNKKAFYGAFGGVLDPFGNNLHWEPKKEEPSHLLDGKSYRQWQIDFSEKFMKPLYGKDIFGRLLVHRHQHRAEDPNYTVLVPDCGFQIELEKLRADLPFSRILLVKVYRDGCDFSKDSRGYLNRVEQVTLREVWNNGTKQEFEVKILEIAQEFIR